MIGQNDVIVKHVETIRSPLYSLGTTWIPPKRRALFLPYSGR